jgi:hypothetical protein
MKRSRFATDFRQRLVVAVMAGALMGASVYAADTPQNHPVATATSLEKQAAEYRAAADRHEKMGQMHQAGAGSSKVNHDSIVKHCETIAKNLRAAADESEALAAEYRKQME